MIYTIYLSIYFIFSKYTGNKYTGNKYTGNKYTGNKYTEKSNIHGK
jgi:hypothetical protein